MGNFLRRERREYINTTKYENMPIPRKSITAMHQSRSGVRQLDRKDYHNPVNFTPMINENM